MTKGIDPSTLGLPAAHYNQLTIALSGKDFSTVVQQMKVVRDEYEIEILKESMRSEPLFAEFLESQSCQWSRLVASDVGGDSCQQEREDDDVPSEALPEDREDSV